MIPAQYQRKLLIPCGATLFVLFHALGGCSRSDQQRTPATQAAASKSEGSNPGSAGNVQVKHYVLKGEVRKVDREGRQVTIRHEEVPGFMAAMTMPFRLEDQALLEELRPGDQVEGKLTVEFEDGQTRDYRLKDLAVTKPAL